MRTKSTNFSLVLIYVIYMYKLILRFKGLIFKEINLYIYAEYVGNHNTSKMKVISHTNANSKYTLKFFHIRFNFQGNRLWRSILYTYVYFINEYINENQILLYNYVTISICLYEQWSLIKIMQQVLLMHLFY